MILDVTFDPVDGSILGDDIVNTNVNLSISASLECTMENIDNGDGTFDCDPDAVAAGLACASETCTELTQSCNACVTITNIDIEISNELSGVTITDGLPGTITGEFTMDEFDQSAVSHVPKGSSTKLSPTTINTIPTVPINRDIFKVKPDPRQSKTINITATATDSLSNTYIANYTYITNQDNDIIKTWITDYLVDNV